MVISAANRLKQNSQTLKSTSRYN